LLLAHAQPLLGAHDVDGAFDVEQRVDAPDRIIIVETFARGCSPATVRIG